MARRLTAITLAAAPVFGALMGCASVPPVTLTVADTGRTIEMFEGQDLILTLETDRWTGFRWWLADSTEVVLIPLGKPGYTEVDSHGAETWRFRAAKQGRQTLKFDYKRAAGDDAEKSLHYDVVVVE
jgi:predicted secreted protein